MSARRLHDDQIDIDDELVRRLVDSQFPQWAELPLVHFDSTGTDNAIFRLGSELSVRLPLHPRANGKVEKEAEWLPLLAQLLPCPIPVPVATGRAGEGYPLAWSVHPWIDGDIATIDHVDDVVQLALDVADFVIALQRIDTTGGPAAGAHNNGRGLPLAFRDPFVRASLEQLDGVIDTVAATKAWDSVLTLPEWDAPPVWVHGDLSSSNLLVADGRLRAVIDFGCLGVGDPACEAQIAWSLFSGTAREAYRAALGFDDATWARGRGWALSGGLIGLPYYGETHPVFAERALQEVTEALADFAQ